MKEQKALRILYVLSAASLLLPWFTYNAKIMGYCWGFDFLIWMFLPMLMVGLCLFRVIKGSGMWLAAEISAFLNLVILVFAFGKWQDLSNIKSGFHFQDGLRTATVFFWFSAAVFFALFILLTHIISKRSGDK